MKKVFLTITIILVVFSIRAQASELNIQSANQTFFDVILNGQLLAERVSTVSITELQPGNHHLQLLRSIHPWNYLSGNQQALFNGYIQVAPNQSIDALVFQNQLYIQQTTALQQTPNYGQQVNNLFDNYHYSYPGQSNQVGNYMPGMNTHWNVPPPSCSGCTQIPVPVGPQAMDPATFQQLKQSIQSQWFSSSQQQVFMQALAHNYFTSQQVLELVDLFTFSSDQLQVAKSAYSKTIDPQNYFIVSNALAFSYDVSELANYIAAL